MTILTKVTMIKLLSAVPGSIGSIYFISFFFLNFLLFWEQDCLLFNRTASVTLSAVIGTERFVWECGALSVTSTDICLKNG